MSRPARRDAGVVLLVVLFFALLLTSSIATFVRRSTVDYLIAGNRDASGRAEALARGGVRLATALLLKDRLEEQATGLPIDGPGDDWYRVGDIELDVGDGSLLRLRVEDSGAKLNLNALVTIDESGSLAPQSEPLIREMLDKVVEEMPGRPEEKLYDTAELASNLIDWVDPDDLRRRGGPEDSYYQEQDPPYRAANQPFLSVDELRLVEGFDGKLVDALRPYVTVYPYAGGGGINPNTAPPHVLSLLFFDDGVDLRLADEDTVREFLRAREDSGLVCPEGNSDEGCTPIREIVTNAIYPQPTFSSNVFEIRAEARVGEVRRSVEAVVDRTEPSQPLLLSWRVR